MIGRRRKKIYRLGDEVKVRIKKTDIDRRLIDWYAEKRLMCQEEWKDIMRRWSITGVGLVRLVIKAQSLYGKGKNTRK